MVTRNKQENRKPRVRVSIYVCSEVAICVCVRARVCYVCIAGSVDVDVSAVIGIGRYECVNYWFWCV